MDIQLNKFGTTLTSRQLGGEAFKAFKPSLDEISDNENLFVHFEGVNTFSPSWGDEFLTPLMDNFKGRVSLKKTDNLSVIETLNMLEQIHGYKFKIID